MTWDKENGLGMYSPMKSEGRRSHKDHNQMLFSLQQDYLVNRKEKTLVRMYEVFKELGQNLVRDYFRNRGLFLAPLDLSSKAHDIGTMAIERYIRDKDFRVNDSFSGWVRNGIFLKVMFKDKTEEQCLSYESTKERGSCQDYSDANTQDAAPLWNSGVPTAWTMDTMQKKNSESGKSTDPDQDGTP